MTISSAAHEAMWTERVKAWRSSGETVTAFAKQHGFSQSALRYWATRLSRPRRPPAVPTVLPLVLKSQATTAAVPTPAVGPELVVEIGAARIRVSRGFDPEMLGAVARALAGGAR